MAFEAAERQRCTQIICEQWSEDTRIVESKDVYERLRAEGINPPPGAMDAYLTLLNAQGLIRAEQMLSSDEIAKHGNMAITYVSEDLC